MTEHNENVDHTEPLRTITCAPTNERSVLVERVAREASSIRLTSAGDEKLVSQNPQPPQRYTLYDRVSHVDTLVDGLARELFAVRWSVAERTQRADPIKKGRQRCQPDPLRQFQRGPDRGQSRSRKRDRSKSSLFVVPEWWMETSRRWVPQIRAPLAETRGQA